MTKAELSDNVKRWGDLRKNFNQIEAKRREQLQPYLDDFERKTAAINTGADRATEPLLREMSQIQLQIEAAMLAKMQSDGTTTLREVNAGDACAFVTTDKKREIDAATFMRVVPPGLRGDSGFLACLSVLVGKAERYLDKPTLDRVVRPKLTHSVTLTLKNA